MIAIGGGVASSGAALVDPLRAIVRASAWPPAAEAVRIAADTTLTDERLA